ncbi:hypothetical protein BLOT_003152, partial [Blomia tropicalis]
FNFISSDGASVALKKIIKMHVADKRSLDSFVVMVVLSSPQKESVEQLKQFDSANLSQSNILVGNSRVTPTTEVRKSFFFVLPPPPPPPSSSSWKVVPIFILSGDLSMIRTI